MTRIPIFLLALAALVVPASVSAQRIEVGASIGLGIGGSEASLLRGESTTMPGARASVWCGDRLETGVRMAWWPIPSPGGSAGYAVNCGDGRPSSCEWVYVNIDRVTPRQFIGAEVIYHFRRGQRLRPFVGGGYGRMDTSEDISCATPGCESLLSPDFPFGRRTSSATDPIAIGGVSYAITDHLLLRGSARFHRFGGEDLSTLETAVEVGVKF